MRRFINQRRVRRNLLFSRVLLFGGLGVLAGGFIISLITPLALLPFLVVPVTGILMVQVGLALTTRWSRRPRVDERIDAALKGLDDRHAAFH